MGPSACVGDYDNDGYLDLFVTYWGQSVLYRNNGDGTFSDVTTKAGFKTSHDEWSTGCSFLDYDRDGKADIFIARYVDFRYESVPRPGQGQWCQWKGINEIGGEEGAEQLNQLLAAGLPPLYRRAYRILGNAADAEDTLHDALLAAYTHLDQFRGQAQISTWLTTIVRNCVRLQLGRRPRNVHVSLDQFSEKSPPVSASERLADRRPNPEDQRRESELRARLTHLNRQLSPTLRRTFQLRDVDGLSIRETADFGNTTRHCESSVNTSSQETQRIDASHSQTAISEAAKSIVGFRKFDTLAT